MSGIRLNRISPEVAIAADRVVRVQREDVELLKQFAAGSNIGRSRICAHKDSGDQLHEMLIALGKQTYIRPHKHFNKSESFHIVEGEVDIVIFHETGAVSDVIQLGDFPSGRAFFYRLADPWFHTLLIRSEVVVFHETTNGPFKKEETVFAPWSPEEKDAASVRTFMEALSQTVANLALKPAAGC